MHFYLTAIRCLSTRCLPIRRPQATSFPRLNSKPTPNLTGSTDSTINPINFRRYDRTSINLSSAVLLAYTGNGLHVALNGCRLLVGGGRETTILVYNTRLCCTYYLLTQLGQGSLRPAACRHRGGVRFARFASICPWFLTLGYRLLHSLFWRTG